MFRIRTGNCIIVNEVNANVGMKLDGTAIKLEAVPVFGVVFGISAAILYPKLIEINFMYTRK